MAPDIGDEAGDKIINLLSDANNQMTRKFLEWLVQKGGDLTSYMKGATSGDGIDYDTLLENIRKEIEGISIPDDTATDLEGQMQAQDLEDAAREASYHSHTQGIAEKVASARELCTDFDDFKRILAERGIGVTTTKDGENMFYEARHDENGEILPYSREARDWAVGADSLKDYGVDATNRWFEENTPKDPGDGGGGGGPSEVAVTPKGYTPEGRKLQVPLRVGPPRENEPQFFDEDEPPVADGSLDTDGRTPDLDQGIESHDGMDTDTRTRRIEREGNGTDVAPHAREPLKDVAREASSSSKQLAKDEKTLGPDIDLSNKMNPER